MERRLGKFGKNMQNITRPFLSVVVPTRDRGDWLEQCIDAILRQSFTDFEVVIVDNDSNDDGKTKKVFEDKSKDSRLRYKRTGGLGMAANWQVAVEEARGEYIVVCSDRLLLQNWLLESLGKLLAAGEFDAGRGESEDMLFLIESWLSSLPKTIVFFAGFSFGSFVFFDSCHPCKM